MSSQRASGVATVMFTDVEASTELTTRQGDDAAGRLFAEHDRIVRDQVAAHGGRHVRSTGDGFLVVFGSARSAVACALSIQRDLDAEEDGVQVRIGLNSGEVVEGDGELFGAAVNLAARVMERAQGGQVLVTDTVRQLAGTMPDARFRDRGRAALKGFPERQRLFEVRPGDGRPPRGATRRRRRRAALAGATLAVGAVAAAVVLATTAGEDPVAVRINSVAILDPDDGKVVAQVPVGVRPTGLAVGDGSVWAVNADDNSVTQIVTRSLEVAGTVYSGDQRRRARGRPERCMGRGRRPRRGARDRPGLPQRRTLRAARRAKRRAAARGDRGRRLGHRRLGQRDRAPRSTLRADRREDLGRQWAERRRGRGGRRLGQRQR